MNLGRQGGDDTCAKVAELTTFFRWKFQVTTWAVEPQKTDHTSKKIPEKIEPSRAALKRQGLTRKKS